mmetsp:Transcript_29314/g.44156  ORF Transcript_29314/g.44156 Transcript_29314/m.44156 type:complete len:100 (-) Transcript_29314:271-570(-)
MGFVATGVVLIRKPNPEIESWHELRKELDELLEWDRTRTNFNMSKPNLRGEWTQSQSNHTANRHLRHFSLSLTQNPSFRNRAGQHRFSYAGTPDLKIIR